MHWDAQGCLDLSLDTRPGLFCRVFPTERGDHCTMGPTPGRCLAILGKVTRADQGDFSILVLRYEPFHPLEGLSEFLTRDGICATYVPLASASKDVARHDRHVLLQKESLGKFLVGEACFRDRGECIERTLRSVAREPQSVEALDKEVTPHVVFPDHPVLLLLSPPYPLEGCNLPHDRCTEHDVLVNLERGIARSPAARRGTRFATLVIALRL